MDRQTVLLIAAYASLPLLRCIDLAIAPGGPEPGGISAPVYFGIPGILAAFVGWKSTWAGCAIHAALLAATALVSYLLVDITGSASPHSDPVTFETAPWYYVGFLTVFIPGVLLGRLARQAHAQRKSG